jgi:hypothetical protein
VLVGIDVLADYRCFTYYLFNPYLALWHTLAWLVVSAALIERNQNFSRLVIGDEYSYGRRLFLLGLVSLTLNGVLSIVLMTAYRVINLLIGSPC